MKPVNVTTKIRYYFLFEKKSAAYLILIFVQ